MKRANFASSTRSQRELERLPTRGATPPVEIAIRTGPALTIACIATKP